MVADPHDGNHESDASFDKYARHGAYHWRALEAGLLRRSLPLRTRYDAVRRALPRRARVVVEVGCGDGALSYHLADTGARDVLGCDTNARGIELAREEVRDRRAAHAVRFVCGRFEDCAVRPASVDAIVLADVIEHVPHPAPLLHAIHGSLRKGGCLIVTTPCARPGMPTWDHHHCQEYTVPTLTALLGTVFRDVLVRPFMPIALHKLYAKHPAARAVFNLAAAAGVNPLAIRWRGAAHVMLYARARA